MLTFREFLQERAILSAYNISRPSMPQIDDQEKFCKHLKNCGKSFIVSGARVAGIKPVQMEIDQDKVDAMAESDDLDSKPIIISKDKYIIDGHHRYFATKQSGKGNIQTIKLDMNLNDALRFATDYAES